MNTYIITLTTGRVITLTAAKNPAHHPTFANRLASVEIVSPN